LKLKKIEMFGFKSFADKIEVQFEDGVTGIVGPNGCGKSNVADAVRWVLGEQSAKALRGQSMQDVIFNGTEKRKSQSFCEVSLFFDNHERIFPLDYEEVIISRKLYRSGDSVYLINKNESRLKDIVDLFRDSGLGKESYSIIGQGKIDEILSAKPENRRAIFEEAAGISKFKSRKIEAERKLERTRENLSRVRDIVHELELQLGPLKKQSENAKKYLELKEQLKILEVNTYIYQYDSASENKEKINNRIAGIDAELNVRRKDFDEAVERYNKSLVDIDNLDANIAKMRDELLYLTVSMEKQVGENKVLAERNANLQDNIQRIEESEGNFADRKEKLNQDLSENREQLSYITSVIIGLEDKLTKITDEYLSVVDKVTSCEHLVEVSGNEELQALDQLSSVKADISGLDAKNEAITSQIKEYEDRQVQILEKIKQLTTEKNEVELNQKRCENESKELMMSHSKLITSNDDLIKKQEELKAETELLNANYHSENSKYSIMLEMQKANEGYAFAVKKILNDAKTNASVGGLVVGVVASLIKVPEKYETAVEMALGSAVQNIVTKDENDAKKLVEYLKASNSGRATFLPISSIKEKYLPHEYTSKLKIHGCYGVASDLISYDKTYDNIFKGLLGSTVIVDNIDTAITLAKSVKYGFKIVTLEGDIINPFGSIAGGSRKADGLNLIGRQREIQKLKSSLDVIYAKLQENNAKIEKNAVIIEKNVLKIKSNSEKLIVFDVNNEALKQKISDTINLINDYDSESKMLTSQLEILKKNQAEIHRLLKDNVGLETKISEGRSSAYANKQNITDEYGKLKEAKNRLSEELSSLKVSLAEKQANKQTCQLNVDRMERELDALEFAISQNEIEKQKCLKDIELNNKLIEANTDSKALKKNQSKLNEIKSEIASLDIKKESLQKAMQKADSDKMELSSELQTLAEKRNKEEIQLTKVDIDIETMQERVWEEYELTYALAQKYKQANYNLNDGIAETARLKKSISALGNINVNAIEQLKDVSDRYDDLAAQQKDLEQGEADLVKIINELTEQMVDRFITQFNLINENFKKIFAELFNGGRAELRLEQSDNLLEAGIDIVAEPSGKKLQSITLLSGGEKAMTAIAILFAILKLRPMPFCILDEIEAALDDANTERFARYLKKFSAETQFIVITHKKPTMELADSLYGVTMEEKGVSKMVSVKLSDAIKNVEESA